MPSPELEKMGGAIWVAESEARTTEEWVEFLDWYKLGADNPNSVVHHSTIARALTLAKAALLALREPTEGMVEAGWEAGRLHYDDLLGRDNFTDAWQAMIDHVLGERE
jgi:hypothetical protein